MVVTLVFSLDEQQLGEQPYSLLREELSFLVSMAYSLPLTKEIISTGMFKLVVCLLLNRLPLIVVFFSHVSRRVH